MELILERIAKRKTYTIGRLYIQRHVDDEYLAGTENQYFCDTLEPTWRDYAHGGRKIKGCSAIPEGRYAVVISYSPAIAEASAAVDAEALYHAARQCEIALRDLNANVSMKHALRSLMFSIQLSQKR